jgi:hypothetical protein
MLNTPPAFSVTTSEKNLGDIVGNWMPADGVVNLLAADKPLPCRNFGELSAINGIGGA